MRLLFGLLLSATLLVSAEWISAERIRAHVRFLSHDLLEGRAPGSRGGLLATEYLAAQFALAGAQPAGPNGSWFQTVPLIGVTTQPDARLTATGEQTLRLGWAEDFVGATAVQEEDVAFSGEVVFAGHGITAPEYQWDDYVGADVSGKVVILFSNEPPSTDAGFFNAGALTYYGRWSYKFEEALRRGAAAVLLIHTDETAGYGWDVVSSSWGREAIQVRRLAGEPALDFAGWITAAAANRLLDFAGHTVDELLAKANTKGFKPIPLGFRLDGRIPSKVRDIETRNVAAVVRGSDSELRDEVVVYSAHWDHLGMAPAGSDRVFNGAVDNATGCAILLELARAWASLETKPARSALFLAVTAEESGLLGAGYFVSHPLVPLGKIAAALNFDSYLPLGIPGSIVVNGAERTTVWPLVQDTARRYKLEIKPDQRPSAGGYFRSDHFAFVRAGVPAFSINMGGDYSGKPAEWIEQQRNLQRSRYHQPSDEYQQDWDFSGLAHIAEYGFLLGRTIAGLDALPTWKAGDPLKPARDATLRGEPSQ